MLTEELRFLDILINVNTFNKKIKNPVFHEKIDYKNGTDELRFDIEISIQDDNYLVEGQSESKVTLHCSRCLKSVESDQQILFKDLYIKNRSDIEKYEVDFYGNIFVVEDGNINLADSIVAALAEQRISFLLCANECKGLCPGCGLNLNKAKCNCNDDNIDPRLEALKNFKI